jgi:type IV pilus assembly protein PilC
MKTGETFSDALVDFPKIFNPLFRAMILAGETGGTLPMVLQRLAQYFDSRDALARKIKGAMAYPIFVLVFVFFMVVVIMTFIIPKFTVIFDQLHGELPFFTQAFMNVYHGIMGYSIFIVMAMVIGFMSFIFFHRTPKGHEEISKFILRIPFIGKILSQGFISMFCRTMSTLLSAGVSVIDALSILSGMTSNDIIKKAVQSTKSYIVEGSNISLSMAASGFFPNMVTKMTQIGEGSGSLPEVLDRTSDFYEKKVDTTVKKLTGFLEPALIITVGAIVLVVVLALYLPIFTMSDANM